MGTMDDEKMSYSGRVDLEMVHFIKAEVKAAVEDHIQATLKAPLPITSMAGGEVDETATARSTDKLPSRLARVVKGWAQGVAILFPLVFAFALLPIISISGIDPLGFSFLALLVFLFMMGYFVCIAIVVCNCLLSNRALPLILET